MAEKIIITLEVDAATGQGTVKDLGKDIKKTNEGVKETGKSVGGLTDRLDKMSGGAITAFKNFASGAKAGVTAMNSLRVAIAATGIGFLVVAILAVKSAFEASEEGQNKFAKILGVIGSVTGNLIDLLSDFGELVISVFENPKKAIADFGNFLKDQVINRFHGYLELIPKLADALDKLLSGDLKGASETAANAIGKVALGIEDTTGAIRGAIEGTKEFIAEQQREAKIAAEIADKRAKADIIERNLILEKAQAESRIAELRLKAKQENEFSAKERQDALIEAGRLTDELTEKEQVILTLRSEALTAENELSKSNKEALTAEAEAAAALIKKETERVDTQRSFQRELNTLQREQAAEAAANAKAQADAFAAIDAALRTSNEQQIFEVRDKYAKLIEAARAYGRDTVELERKRLAELKALDPTTSIDSDQVAMDRIQKRLNEAKLEQSERLKIRTEGLLQEQLQEEKFAEARKNIAAAEKEAKLNIASQIADAVGSLLGRQAAVGKAAAVASATISTFQGAAKSLAVYGPTPLGFAGVAAAVIGGLAQVKNILAVKIPGGGGSGSGAGVSTPSIRPPSVGQSIGLINPIGQNQQIGSDLAQSLSEKPIKAYVTTGEVRSGLDLDRKIRSNGEF